MPEPPSAATSDWRDEVFAALKPAETRQVGYVPDAGHAGRLRWSASGWRSPGPTRRVLVVTGDGEMLMGLGSLATIGVQRPPNLAIAVFDNGHYGETGMQASHTAAGVGLTGVARACGFEQAFDIADALGLREFSARVQDAATSLFARISIRADEPARVLPPRDGVLLKNRFRDATGAERT